MPVRRGEHGWIDSRSIHQARHGCRCKRLCRRRTRERRGGYVDERKTGCGDAHGTCTSVLVAGVSLKDFGALKSSICLELTAECLFRTFVRIEMVRIEQTVTDLVSPRDIERLANRWGLQIPDFISQKPACFNLQRYTHLTSIWEGTEVSREKETV